MSGRETVGPQSVSVCIVCHFLETLSMSAWHIATLQFFQIGPVGIGVCTLVFSPNVKILCGQTSSQNISIFPTQFSASYNNGPGNEILQHWQKKRFHPLDGHNIVLYRDGIMYAGSIKLNMSIIMWNIWISGQITKVNFIG